MKRYDVMRQWTLGFAAGIAMTEGLDESKGEHWNAGYEAGYKMRPAKNEALDQYLISTGREPQAKIRLAANDAATPGATP